MIHKSGPTDLNGGTNLRNIVIDLLTPLNLSRPSAKILGKRIQQQSTRHTLAMNSVAVRLSQRPSFLRQSPIKA